MLHKLATSDKQRILSYTNQQHQTSKGNHDHAVRKCHRKTYQQSREGTFQFCYSLHAQALNCQVMSVCAIQKSQKVFQPCYYWSPDSRFLIATYSEWPCIGDVTYAMHTYQESMGLLLTFSLPDPPSHCRPAQHAPSGVEEASQLIQRAGQRPAVGWAVRARWGEGGGGLPEVCSGCPSR